MQERGERRDEHVGSSIFGLKVGLLFHSMFALFLYFYYMFDKYKKHVSIFLVMVSSLHLKTIPLKKN